MRFLLTIALIGAIFFWVVPSFFAFMGLFGGFMPWLLIGLVFWASSAAFGGRRRHRRNYDRRYERWERRAWEQRQAPPSQAASRQETEADNRRLPLDVELKAAQIRRKVEVLLQHAGEFPLGSEDLYIVRAIANDYLPRTLDAYLKLPARGRERVTVTPDGKTALQELRDQLTMLDGKLDEIATDLERKN
ncbi:MAG: hypothetical protein JOZ39_12470, partial [Chloroflexi bacterium]|nr:hypothetical protein [Chloroflexota bacterium]